MRIRRRLKIIPEQELNVVLLYPKRVFRIYIYTLVVGETDRSTRLFLAGAQKCVPFRVFDYNKFVKMAIRGQRFDLDLDAEDWKFDLQEQETSASPLNVVKEIKERDSSDIPPAPTLKSTKTGFPEHRKRPQSAFKLQQQSSKDETQRKIHEPSDRAILHHAAKKRGVDLASAREKADISTENTNRIDQMSLEEIEEARAELMAQFNPESLRKLMQRANINEDEKQEKDFDNHEASRPADPSRKTVAFAEPRGSEMLAEPDGRVQEDEDLTARPASHIPHPASDVHFPTPPRNRKDYKPLNADSATFLTDLKEHYFPDLPHDPTTLSWLQDPTPAEEEESTYNPQRAGFAPSALRFSFNGTLITPSESLEIPSNKGLHHHGDAPNSAGYTIPELALLCRSTLPNQRCVAYQVLGRLLFRLGRGEFGARGSDLVEGLWTCVEKERPVEVMMAEANMDETKGKVHLSAKAYATEALWLWRRGGGGDRGVLKETERRAQ